MNKVRRLEKLAGTLTMLLVAAWYTFPQYESFFRATLSQLGIVVIAIAYGVSLWN